MELVRDNTKKQGCYKLWKDCFGDSKQYMEYYFTEKIKDNEIYAVEKEGEVISMLHLNPFCFNINGVKQKLHYIVGVATKEEERGQGQMRDLLSDTLRLQSKRGEIFTYLMPAAKEIYLPYDFRYMYTQQRVTGTLEVAGKSNWGVTEYGRISVNEKKQVVSYVNDNLKKAFDCYAVRDIAYYDRLCKEMQAAGGQVVIFHEYDVLLGVCAFMLENGHLEVVETITDPNHTETVLQRLQTYIYKSYEVESVEAAWMETHFLNKKCIKDQLTEAKEVEQPIIMARLLCVKEALEQLRLQPGIESVDARIQVEDSIILENNQIFVIHGDESGITVEQEETVLQAANVEGTTDVETITIADLIEWYFGERKVSALEGVQTLARPYINDIV